MPAPAASDAALPVIDDMIRLVSTVTWPCPPGSRPTIAFANVQSRSEMVEAFMMLAVRMNSGIASSTLSVIVLLSVWSTRRPMSCLLAHR